jgi:hypothetical protein
MYHQFTINKIRSSAHTVYSCFLCGSEKKTAIILLYNINWTVFITETERVYCAVRPESASSNQANLRPSYISI